MICNPLNLTITLCIQKKTCWSLVLVWCPLQPACILLAGPFNPSRPHKKNIFLHSLRETFVWHFHRFLPKRQKYLFYPFIVIKISLNPVKRFDRKCKDIGILGDLKLALAYLFAPGLRACWPSAWRLTGPAGSLTAPAARLTAQNSWKTFHRDLKRNMQI